jgi:hypothetical protein
MLINQILNILREEITFFSHSYFLFNFTYIGYICRRMILRVQHFIINLNLEKIKINLCYQLNILK